MKTKRKPGRHREQYSIRVRSSTVEHLAFNQSVEGSIPSGLMRG